MSEEQNGDFGSWAVVELMGHVKLAGYVTEEERFGVKMGRIDVPGADGQTIVTQYFSGASVYRITPVTEEVARAVAAGNQPQPVTRWDLRALPEYAATPEEDWGF